MERNFLVGAVLAKLVDSVRAFRLLVTGTLAAPFVAAAAPIVTLPATTLPARTAAAGVKAEYARSKTALGELNTAYGATDDFTISLRLPYVRRMTIRGSDGDAVVDRGRAEGIGDLTVLGRYRFAGDPTSPSSTAVLVGIKAPTGVTTRKDPRGEPFDSDDQPGTGSWDPRLGVAGTRRVGAVSLDASILYAIARPGVQSTLLGDRMRYDAAVSRRFAKPDNAWDLVLELNGEWEGRKKVAGVTDAESGGTVLFLSSGARFISSKGWSAFLLGGVRIVQRMRPANPEGDFRLVAGVAWVL